MKLPSRNEAIAMLKEYGMPDNIYAHTMQVNKVANYLAEKMRKNGRTINLELVDRASLLHDLDKHLTLETGNHSELTREILAEKGFPELADAAASHMLENVSKRRGLNSIEEKIVYYADKRVNHDKIVSLTERFEYLKKRYGSTELRLKEIEKFESGCRQLERQLMKISGADATLKELK